MVSRNAVQEVHGCLFLFGCLHTLDDAEIADGGLEGGDVTHIAQPEFRLVRLAVTFGKEFRLQRHVEQQSRHLLARGAGVVRDIAVHVPDKYISECHRL